jgi:uncharacterized Zn-binding protein involved in type VI secretion
MGDQTAHGGSIVLGFPLVTIGGQPAARMGDMHVCPLLNPGVPPPPHVGGPILKGSATVMIGGQPAARMGDPVTCSGPPDSIVGGCPTVLIGDSMKMGAGGGASGSGKGGSSGGSGSSGSGIGESSGSGPSASGKPEGHFLDVTFVDQGGFPIVNAEYQLTSPANDVTVAPLVGNIRQTGVDAGSYDIEIRAIISAKWSKRLAKVGEKVQMTAETIGIPSGDKAVLEVHCKDSSFADRVLKTFNTKVQNDKIEGEWELVIDDEFLKMQDQKLKAGGYSSPAYYFVARSAAYQMRSELMEYKDDIDFKLKDKEGNVIPDKKYRLIMPSGEVKEGKLDGSGSAQTTDVAPGRIKVSINVRDVKFPGAK